ncbi:uncharacterized protein LOC126825263 [Patella vulgata]|uniref:uncharacterized protein LOC126825263 n=1 Tax=Patella vulgata TaxID=6465 RepID=UPI00217FEC9E|nr:uncharacterized protein LOC126825263 [Patella vulgata]
MAYLPSLSSADVVIPPIQQIGNYFIMDSEQLVSNPFTEMKLEAQTDFQKRRSQMEKMTSIRNNVCENNYKLTEDTLEREKSKMMQTIQSDTSKYRFEIKLLELDRRKHDIETRKRIEPNRSYDYDDSQIDSSSQRLGANITTSYLEKRLVYPVRLRSVTDLSVTPLVAKARQSLKRHKLHRDLDGYSQDSRSQTAKSHSQGPRSQTAKSHASTMSYLRSARSAPTLSTNYKRPTKGVDSTTFPVIDKDHFSQRHKYSSTRSNHHQHVKFAGSESSSTKVNRLERTAEILNLASARIYSYEASDSEDDFAEYEKVDLRAILFGKPERCDEHHKEDSVSDKSHNQSIVTDASHHRVLPNQKLTPELLHSQFEQIQKRVNTFLKDCDTPRRYGDSDSDDSLDEAVCERASRFRKFSKTMSDGEERGSDRCFTGEGNNKRKHKKAWEYIKGHKRDSQLGGTYNTQDLVLQRLTGINIGKASKSVIPLNSASRAMRNTPTFKMRQVIERLKANRTRYEEHEINELKRLNESEAEAQAGEDALVEDVDIETAEEEDDTKDGQ